MSRSLCLAKLLVEEMTPVKCLRMVCLDPLFGPLAVSPLSSIDVGIGQDMHMGDYEALVTVSNYLLPEMSYFRSNNVI